MKKIFYIFIFFTVVCTSVGFKGCNDNIIIIAIKILMGYYEVGTQSDGNLVYGIAVGENGKIYTTDGRPPAPWIERPSGTTQQLNAVKIGKPFSVLDDMVDSAVAYAVGNNATVKRSTDKGHTWVNRNIPGEYLNLYGLDVIRYGPGTGVDAAVCGDSGRVFRSTNAGNNWLGYYVGNTIKLNSIAAVNSFVMAAVGDNGAIYRTINGGETWQNRSVSSSISLKKVCTPRYDRYCAVGTGGVIYTSTDYGNSWIPRSSGTTQTFRDVMFPTPDSGFAVGDNGTVRITTNAGVTWFSDTYLSGLTTRDIISIARVDENTVNSITRNLTSDNTGADTTFFLAVSSEPFIGIEPISNFIAEVFNLKQNYPNPFNPITNIEISVPKASFVKLIIYDVQGKEIETLVNEELRAGAYKIDWNALGYPSGVYFYTILAGDYKETKKMILIK